MLELLPQQLVNGVALGSTYALVALGLTLIFGVLLIPNFAHGEFYMVGAFVTYALNAAGLGFWLAAPCAILVVMALGCLVNRLVFRPVETGSGLSLMISALAASIILQQAATLLWGTAPRTIPSPLPGVLRTTLFSVTEMQLAVVAALGSSWLGVWLVLHRTRLGLAIRAVAQNRGAALLMGVDLDVVRYATFAIGAGLGALAGALLGATFPIYPTMGATPVLKAFVVLVIGGIGNLWGAVGGGLLLGVAEVLVGGYVSSQLQDVGAFSLLVATLLLRPQGLFGRAEVER